MKIYTKTGDQGTTSLFSGERVLKNHPLIQAYGTVDELNSVLGILLTEPLSEAARKRLTGLQHELFELGADLATPWKVVSSQKTPVKRMTPGHVAILENEIDAYESRLLKLKQFILPGGCRASAYLHFARTVSRRAERELLSSFQEGNVNPIALVYLNRLSDWLFVMARYVNHESGHKDVIWEKLP